MHIHDFNGSFIDVRIKIMDIMSFQVFPKEAEKLRVHDGADSTELSDSPDPQTPQGGGGEVGEAGGEGGGRVDDIRSLSIGIAIFSASFSWHAKQFEDHSVAFLKLNQRRGTKGVETRGAAPKDSETNCAETKGADTQGAEPRSADTKKSNVSAPMGGSIGAL